jgi:hypothetical protein
MYESAVFLLSRNPYFVNMPGVGIEAALAVEVDHVETPVRAGAAGASR